MQAGWPAKPAGYAPAGQVRRYLAQAPFDWRAVTAAFRRFG